MQYLEQLRNQLPEAAKDIKLNLQTVFQASSLTSAQAWGVALAASLAARQPPLAHAVLAEAQSQVESQTIEDAKAAAVLMGMNNVYYRFRHLIGKEAYTQKPARLRMNWIAKPQGSKIDFELFCLAVSALNGCEVCIRSHESIVLEGGLTEDQVHDAVRLAATIQAAAVALELNELAGGN
jgi:lipoyl-dependent peroxiredoxin subunit D